MIQNFKPYTDGQTASSRKPFPSRKPTRTASPSWTPRAIRSWKNQTLDTQTIVQGPMASQIAIKMLGTNGGGYANANAAHPFENPTPLSNFFQMLSLFVHRQRADVLPRPQTKNQKHGWAVWSAMFAMFLAGVLLCWWAEAQRQSDSSATRRRRRRRQHGRQGSPLRHLQFRAVRHGHDRRLLRRGQFHARFLHAARRVGAAVQHPDSARSFSAASARGFTACSSSSCSPCSSPG